MDAETATGSVKIKAEIAMTMIWIIFVAFMWIADKGDKLPNQLNLDKKEKPGA